MEKVVVRCQTDCKGKSSRLSRSNPSTAGECARSTVSPYNQISRFEANDYLRSGLDPVTRRRDAIEEASRSLLASPPRLLTEFFILHSPADFADPQENSSAEPDIPSEGVFSTHAEPLVISRTQLVSIRSRDPTVWQARWGSTRVMPHCPSTAVEASDIGDHELVQESEN